MKCNNVFSFSYYCFFIRQRTLQVSFSDDVTKELFVLEDYKEKQRRSATMAKRIYNISFGIIILVVGLVVLFIDKIHNDTLTQYFDFSDVLLRYMFGGLCLVYGIFRLYRGIKKDY